MNIYNDFDLTEYNAYNIKAKCRNAYFPDTKKDIIELYKSDFSFILLGSGHNVILSKEYYSDNFIIFNGNFNKIEVDKTANIISAEAGATIFDVSKIAEQNGLTGAEFYYDIPSSVGGAVVMNASTKEGETKHILKKVRFLDLTDMWVKEKQNKDLEFEYRNSMFQKQTDKIILKAWFQLTSGNPRAIRKKMDESKKRRWSKQPREYPNCGSVFKRPTGKFVGPMIDELGLKGHTIGGAQVSKKHGGFIVNVDNATGEDILALIEYIQRRVKERFGIKIEVEQRII